MTGEITLRGRVLPVGGIKEKVLAAHRAGIKQVIIPRENKKDLEEIPANVRRKIAFVLVDNMDEVLQKALLPATEDTDKKSSGLTPGLKDSSAQSSGQAGKLEGQGNRF